MDALSFITPTSYNSNLPAHLTFYFLIGFSYASAANIRNAWMRMVICALDIHICRMLFHNAAHITV